MPRSGQNVRAYLVVYGCVRALTTAVVAVTVAVRETSRPSASEADSLVRAGDPKMAPCAGRPPLANTRVADSLSLVFHEAWLLSGAPKRKNAPELG